TPRRRVQLGIVPEDPLLVERQPPLRLEVRRHPWPLRHPIAQGDQARDPPLEPRHRVRERVAQPLDHLEGGQVDVREVAPDQPPSLALLVAREHVLEPAEVFRQPLLHEVLCPPPRAGGARTRRAPGWSANSRARLACGTPYPRRLIPCHDIRRPETRARSGTAPIASPPPIGTMSTACARSRSSAPS